MLVDSTSDKSDSESLQEISDLENEIKAETEKQTILQYVIGLMQKKRIRDQIEKDKNKSERLLKDIQS